MTKRLVEVLIFLLNARLVFHKEPGHYIRDICIKGR
jgi:hypothetical protein